MEKIDIKETIPCRDEVGQRIKDYQNQSSLIQTALSNFLTGVAVSMGINMEKYQYDFIKNIMVLKKEDKENGEAKNIKPT